MPVRDSHARASAHAKIILLGEHFVLPWTDSHGNFHPGSSALALPLPDLLTEVDIAPGREFGCFFEIAYEDAKLNTLPLLPLMENAVKFLAAEFKWDLKLHPLRFLSRSHFPISRGLGSSASFSVALTRAFLAYQNLPVPADIGSIVQKVETLFHGKSSGLDTAAVLNDQPILFRNGQVIQNFRQTAVDLVIIDSSPRENSSAWIQKTIDFKLRQPQRWLDYSAQISHLADECLTYLTNPANPASSANLANSAVSVGKIIDDTQSILNDIGLMTPPMQRILELGRKLGALAGKMTGAGGGGAMLFVTHSGGGLHLAQELRKFEIRVLTVLTAQPPTPIL